MAITANGSKSAAEKPGRRLRIPLWLKFATVIVALAALLLLAGGAISLWWGYNEAQRAALSAQQQRAEALAGKIGGAVAELESQLAWTAQPAWKDAGIDQQRTDFTRMLRQFPAITELVHIDGEGSELLKVSRSAPDSIASLTNHASEPRFVETVKARTWFGPVYVRNGSQLSATVGVAHVDGGVSVAEIDLAFVTTLVNAAAQADGSAFVVDRAGRLIAHPSRNAVTGDTDLSGLPQVQSALAAGGTGATVDAIADEGAPALAAYAEVPGPGWMALSQTPKAAALAPFRMLLWQSALLLGVGLLAAAMVGIWLARRVAAPINRLQAGAERLGQGDFTQRIAVRRRDEVGALADKFNTMASLLQQSHKGLEAKMDDRAVGFDIAQQQQSLTAEMLKTISRSDYQLDRVLDTLIGDAVRLAEANVGAVWLRQGDAFRLAAQLGHTGDWVEAARKTPFTAGSETHAMAAAAAYSGQVVNVDDVLHDVRFAGDYGERPAYSDERSALALPLKHDGKVQAVFALSRADPLPFIDRQVAVAQDFADQALIAIRHRLLLDEVETRDRKLERSSEEQAATGNILRVISKAPDDIRPVLETIARSAARFCDAPACHIELFDGRLLHFKAHHGLSPDAIESVKRTFPAEPLPGTAAARAIDTGAVVEIADIQTGQETGTLSALLGSKSVVAVPLLKNGQPVGVLTVERQEAGALPARQIELLKTFADQAAIALESARLADELRTRTSSLASSLKREAATGTLLETVSRTDYGLDDVLAALAGRAALECAADGTQFFLLDGEILRDASGNEAGAEGHASLARRVIAGTAALNLLDAWQDPEHAGKAAVNRSMLGLPLLAKGKILGALTLTRGQVLPFDEEQAKLAAELADQAALAIAGAQLPVQLAERTAERDDARQRHATDVEAAEHRRVTELDETVRLHAAEMDDVRRRHEAELNETRRLHAEELAERTAERDEARHLHVSDVAAAQQQHAAEIEETRQRHEAEIGDILGRHAEELAERTRERDEWQHRHAADVDAAERQRVAEMEEARRLHAAAVEEAQQRREAELAEAGRQHAEELEGTITTHAAELGETRQLHATELAGARHLHQTDLVEARRLHTEDRDTARLQRIATADALKRVADPSPGLDAVLQTIVGSAARACDAAAGILFRTVGDRIEAAATFGLADNHEILLDQVRHELAARVITEGNALHVAASQGSEAAFHAALGVPLTQNGAAQGALVLLRTEAEPFGDELASLATSFCDQAAIAIETERLSTLAALRAGQLEEAARFRGAAARVLDLVGRVEADPQQVLDAVVATAAELCRAASVELRLSEGSALRLIASVGTAGDGSAAQRAVTEGRIVQITTQPADGATHGTALAVPMMLDGKSAGALVLRRDEAGAFDEHEIELADTLAAQASIAIAATRLAGALDERSQSLSHARREQQATASMLATIGRSHFDLGAVLDTLAHSAAELCGAGMAAICLDRGATLESAGSVGFPDKWPGDQRYLQTAGLARRAIREAAPLQSSGDAAAGHALAIPLIGDGKAIGALVIARPEAFGDADATVAATLADQAVIAIGNVQLLEAVETRTAELGEALRQQAATADIQRSVNDAAFELKDMLSAVTDHAARLCGATTARLYLGDGEALRFAAGAGLTAGQRGYEEANPERMNANSLVGRAAIERTAIHAPDLTDDTDRMPADAKFGNAAAMLCVPLLREGSAIGVIALTRTTPGPFGERQIGLVQTFADQAATAIENLRLFDEAQTRTADLGEAVRQQRAAADILKSINSATFDLGGVLTTLTASAAALCSAGGAAIYLQRDGAYRLAAATGAMPEQLVGPHLPDRANWIGRVAQDGTAIHVADTDGNTAHPEIARIGGLAAILCVPLQRDETVIGVFALTRSEPGPFTERQIALIRTFADQAVIAIESLRLFAQMQTHDDELSRLMKDLHAAQARLLQTDKLATLGQLTAGIASEIEERLNAVNDVTRLSNKLVDDIRMVLEAAVIDGGTRAEVEDLGDTLKAHLDKVVWNSKRADSVVRNMLMNLGGGRDGSHGDGSGEHRPVDINSVVDESLGLAYHDARAGRKDFGITLEKKLDPQAGAVDIYRPEITRALLNLIANGFYAAEKRSAESNGAGYQPVLAASTRNLGDAVEIRIRDNGTGIPADVQAKMFTPFFTTKPAGEGTGLGLSFSHDIIVNQHSGTIDVETVPGSFTEFRIVLPRSGASTATGDTAQNS